MVRPACPNTAGPEADRRAAPADKYQLEIVRNGGLPPLLRLLRSSFLPLIQIGRASCRERVS